MAFVDKCYIFLSKRYISLEKDALAIFKYDLNNDMSEEFFFLTDLSGDGNACWEVFNRAPFEHLGTINGEFVYLVKGNASWPMIISFWHSGAKEGLLCHYRHDGKEYQESGHVAVSMNDTSLIDALGKRKCH